MNDIFEMNPKERKRITSAILPFKNFESFCERKDCMTCVINKHSGSVKGCKEIFNEFQKEEPIIIANKMDTIIEKLDTIIELFSKKEELW